MSDHFVGDPGRAAPASKAELCDLIASGWDEIEQAIAGIMPTDMELRPDGGWSVIDHLAHIAVWERGTTALLEGRPPHEAMAISEQLYLSDDDDAINQAVWSLHVDRPAAATLAELRDAHAALVAVLDGLSDDALERTSSAFLPGGSGHDNGEPMRTRLVGDTYGHYVEHAAAIRALREV